jgi:hypothetical protein
MIKIENFTFDEAAYFPILCSEDCLSNADRAELLSALQQMFASGAETQSFGQNMRNNIVVNEETLPALRRVNTSFDELYNCLDSHFFRSKLQCMFEPEVQEIWTQEHSKFNVVDSSLEIHLARSTEGYENPFHVDTRRRLIHGLIYLDDELFSGGDFAIAKCPERLSGTQLLHPNDIVEEKIYRVKKGLGILVLSTPSSFHKGMRVNTGERYFIYFAYNAPREFWRKKWNWALPMPFEKALEYHRQQGLKRAGYFMWWVVRECLRKLVTGIRRARSRPTGAKAIWRKG